MHAAPTPSPFRHPRWVRLTHWLTVLAFAALLVSGGAILLALPKLFWGETGANDAPPWVSLPLPVNLEQTGWGRNLHFLAAWVFVLNGLVYGLMLLLTGRLRRKLLPAVGELCPAHVAREIGAHLRPAGGPPHDPGRYNVLQKLAYLAVVGVLAPMMILSGLTMSPGVTAAYPELFALFGGRQSARTIHFLTAVALVLFLVVHVWQVLANDPVRLLRGMGVGGMGVGGMGVGGMGIGRRSIDRSHEDET